MNIAYIGSCDQLAARVVDYLGKEDNTIYLLSGEDFKKKNKPSLKYRFLSLMQSTENLFRYLKSINPQIIIYAGEAYMEEEWKSEVENDIQFLISVLENTIGLNIKKFILLSSTEVYGRNGIVQNEESTIEPQSLKGMRMALREKTLEIYCKKHKMEAAIIRSTSTFSENIEIGGSDLLGRMSGYIAGIGEEPKLREIIQPVHIFDLTDAVKRVMNSDITGIYNVAATKELKRNEIYELITRTLGSDNKLGNSKEAGEVQISSNKIKEKVEWSDFWQLDVLLKEKKINFSVNKKENNKEEKKENKKYFYIRKFVEIMIVFLFFAAMYFMTLDHNLFGRVGWLQIYVTVISLFYGVRYGTFGIALAIVAFLAAHGGSILMMDNFYSYADKILMIVELIFLGIISGYTVEMLKERLREKELRIEDLENNIRDLEEISDKTIIIKNEYEKRILDNKDSLSRLYTIISKIQVLEEGRIIMGVINVIQDLLNTNTVSIYRYNHKSPFLRLLGSLNEDSLVDGRSWNIDKYPKIKQVIERHEIYEGDIWNGEPAIVMSVGITEGYSMVVVVKKLELSNVSLHTLNLMRTIFVLLSTSMKRALNYDNITREQKYIGDTDILKEEEFAKVIAIAEEKRQQKMSEYCLLTIDTKEDIISTYHKVENAFREVDFFGMDKNQKLRVLLDNTGSEDEKFVMARLAKMNILAKKEGWN